MYCWIEKALFIIRFGMSDRHTAGPHLVTEVGSIADAVGICGMTSIERRPYRRQLCQRWLEGVM